MRFVLAVNKNDNYAFVERDWAENDPSWRQVIPYVAIKDQEGRIALFQRKNGSEKRLSDLYTIGVGGHIDIGDVPVHHASGKGNIQHFVNEICQEAMRRELWEEIQWVPLQDEILPVFVLESSDTPVDCVHRGLCCVVEWSFPEDTGYQLPGLPAGNFPESSDEQMRYVMRNEDNPEMEFVGFKSLNEISSYNLESWSRKFVDALRSA